MDGININHRNEIFYRYKMPRVEIKIERNKTVIVNLVEVSKSLNTSPIYILKHLSYTLGVQCRFDKRHKTYKLNGCHEKEKNQQNVFDFIKSFVLCRTCENPETEMVIRCKNYLYTQCNVCGNRNLIKDCDKLVKFIINSQLIEV